MDFASPEEAEAMLNRLFQEAMADAEAGRLAEGADKLETVAAATRHPGVLWNLGTMRAQLEEHERALAVWDAYRRLVPEDWRARSKVIQACQALGDTARRDRERAELLALHAAGADPELAAERNFCREQFQAGGRPVVAYEHFDPSGPHRVFYAFLVGHPDGTLEGRYSLGSYDFTTEPARERGDIGPDERIYHLDWYAGSLHSTLGFYNVLPDYDQVRAHVVAALAGTLRPVSHGIRPERPVDGEGSDAAPSGATATPPMADPPPPAPPPASPGSSPPPSHERKPWGGSGGGAAPTGPLERVASWAARLMGRRDDRPN